MPAKTPATNAAQTAASLAIVEAELAEARAAVAPPVRDASCPEANPLNDEPLDGPLIESSPDDEDRPWGTCRCGSAADKRSSGVPECWPCWRWRKLDGPAARHWTKVGTAFLSNIDMHDLSSFFDRAGISATALNEVRDLVEFCNREIEAHNPANYPKHVKEPA